MLRFVLVGALNTGFSYLVYSFLIWLGLQFALANLGALLMGVLFSFLTQGKFVFNNSDRRLFLRFLVGWLVIYCINTLLIALLKWYGFNSYSAGALALAPVVLLSYVLQKFIVFPKR
jgi:putative flippase GtrA